MTDQNALSEAQIRRLLEFRATRANATGLFDDISAEIAGNPHRAARSDARPMTWVLGAAAAAVLAVAGAAFLLRGPSEPGAEPIGPTPSPSLSPSPDAGTAEGAASATPVASSPTPSRPRPLAPAGLEAPTMDAGTWSSVAFDPGVTFTVPSDRWAAGLDLPQQVYLRAHLPGAPAEEIDAWTIFRVEDVYIDPCALGAAGGTRQWDEGTDAFFDWLAEESPLDLGAPYDLMLAGRPARAIDLVIPQFAFTGDCQDGYLPIGTVAGGGGQIAIPRNGFHFQMAAIDDDGRTLLMVTWARPEHWDAMTAATDQMLATLEFQ
jgi:hypothetical protein